MDSEPALLNVVFRKSVTFLDLELSLYALHYSSAAPVLDRVVKGGGSACSREHFIRPTLPRYRYRLFIHRYKYRHEI